MAPRGGHSAPASRRWSHHGGTWGLPGGARKRHESSCDAALRKAGEEAGVPADAFEPLFESLFDLGFWSYSTVVVRVVRLFAPIVADAESVARRWVPIDEEDALPLHPGFAASRPALRERLG